MHCANRIRKKWSSYFSNITSFINDSPSPKFTKELEIILAKTLYHWLSAYSGLPFRHIPGSLWTYHRPATWFSTIYTRTTFLLTFMPKTHTILLRFLSGIPFKKVLMAAILKDFFFAPTRYLKFFRLLVRKSCLRFSTRQWLAKWHNKVKELCINHSITHRKRPE